MQNSFPNGEGAMAAILGLDIDEVIETIDSSEIKNVCQVANDNAPGQIVISGEINAVNDIISLLKDKGAKKAIKLHITFFIAKGSLETEYLIISEIFQITLNHHGLSSNL